jgi:hypothetical protein
MHGQIVARVALNQICLYARSPVAPKKTKAFDYDDRRLEFLWLYDEHLCTRYKRAIEMISLKG